MSPKEPTLSELRDIRQQLYGAPSTDENLKKIRAIEAQIARHEKMAEAQEEETAA